MGAAMLCGVAGIDNSTLENSASYIDSWLRALKKESRLGVRQESYFLGHSYTREIFYSRQRSAVQNGHFLSGYFLCLYLLQNLSSVNLLNRIQ